jgi:DNA-binding response OmpR family regulator
MKRVVVACTNDRATELSAAIAARSLLPILAFTGEQFLRAVRAGADAAVVHPHVVGGTSVIVAAAESDVGMLLLADAQRLDPDMRAVAIGVMPPSTRPTEVATFLVGMLQERARREVGAPLQWGTLHIDLDRRRVVYDELVVDVTPLQLRLLASLVRAQGAVRTRDELQAELWPGEPPDDGRRLDAHIRRIRARLEDSGADAGFIVTVRGEGFRLADVANGDIVRRDQARARS